MGCAMRPIPMGGEMMVSRKNSPLRAPLGAARQALLASPSRGEVNSVGLASQCHSPNVTLPLEGLRAGQRQVCSSGANLGEKAMSAMREWLVAKLGPQGLGKAGEGVVLWATEGTPSLAALGPGGPASLPAIRA